ncbi:hypothetical protein R3P38DRAFT_2806308 [Favolaschia claudopus]|uniref:Uncharacterized protein n=1 Tax=Favolaschia claudopus TaxID=2862362 RepID=A0AAV9ZKG4_9AGAR
MSHPNELPQMCGERGFLNLHRLSLRTPQLHAKLSRRWRRKPRNRSKRHSVVALSASGNIPQRTMKLSMLAIPRWDFLQIKPLLKRTGVHVKPHFLTKTIQSARSNILREKHKWGENHFKDPGLRPTNKMHVLPENYSLGGDSPFPSPLATSWTGCYPTSPMDIDSPISNCFSPMDVDEPPAMPMDRCTCPNLSPESYPLTDCDDPVPRSLSLQAWENWDSDDIIEKRDIYEQKWGLLQATPLRFLLKKRHVPWPILKNGIEASVAWFLFDGNMTITQKKRAIRRNLLIFHPDKVTQWISKCAPQDWEEIMECAQNIGRELIEHLAKLCPT